MVETFLILIGLQLLGEWLSLWLALPIPGPVLGMLLLFIGLCALMVDRLFIDIPLDTEEPPHES